MFLFKAVMSSVFVLLVFLDSLFLLFVLRNPISPCLFRLLLLFQLAQFFIIVILGGDRFLAKKIVLFLLEFLIDLDALVHSHHIWECFPMALLHCLGDFLGFFPVGVLDEKAHVNNRNGGRPCDTGGAVNKCLQLLLVDKLVDDLRSLKQTSHVLLLVVIIEWLMNDGLNAGLSIHHFDVLLVDSSLADLSLSLADNDGLATLSGNFVHISLA
jgi:hypothetical protein